MNNIRNNFLYKFVLHKLKKFRYIEPLLKIFFFTNKTELSL